MKKLKAEQLIARLKEFDSSITVCGDTTLSIDGFSSIYSYREGSLTWMKNGGDADISPVEKLTAVILGPDVSVNSSLSIHTSNPKYLFFKALEYMDDSSHESMIQPTAVIAKNAKLSAHVSIGHYSVIGAHAVIGENTVIGHHVVIGDHTVIGRNCHIKSGAVIGERGFGYSKHEGEYTPVPHYGKVILGNFVDVGSQTCIDRGTLEDTVIEDGVKIDNLCHIAHNVRIDRDCMIIANASIGGSVHVEQGSYIALCATVLNQKTIGKGSVVGMSSVVTKDIPPESVCAYSPARVLRQRTESDRQKY